MFRVARGAALASLLIAGAPAAFAQQWSLGIDATDSASGFSRETGRRFVFICPAIDEPRPEVWGIDAYASESAICTAAIHAGFLSFGQAGLVAIVMIGEVASFRGSGRNGVKTLDYGNSGYAYTFTNDLSPAEITWATSALRIPRGFDQPVTVICPPGGTTDGAVWGTDTYITDSPICLTAVHAGVITLDGGAVTVTKVPGIESYEATRRHDVESRGWSAWDDAFQVSPGEAVAAATAAGGPRTIRTAGYTGAGNGADIVPRTIRVSGYTGTGNGADIVPRTIRIDGWTGAGAAP